RFAGSQALCRSKCSLPAPLLFFGYRQDKSPHPGSKLFLSSGATSGLAGYIIAQFDAETWEIRSWVCPNLVLMAYAGSLIPLRGIAGNTDRTLGRPENGRPYGSFSLFQTSQLSMFDLSLTSAPQMVPGGTGRVSAKALSRSMGSDDTSAAHHPTRVHSSLYRECRRPHIRCAVSARQTRGSTNTNSPSGR